MSNQSIMVLSCQISIAVEGNPPDVSGTSIRRMPGCPILIGPRLLACAREDGDVEVQWEEGIGVTICHKMLRIQIDSQAVHLVILYIPFVVNCSVNIPTASES